MEVIEHQSQSKDDNAVPDRHDRKDGKENKPVCGGIEQKPVIYGMLEDVFKNIRVKSSSVTPHSDLVLRVQLYSNKNVNHTRLLKFLRFL